MSPLERVTKVLAIPGSLRRLSHNRAVLEAAADQAPSSVEIAVFEGMETIPVFNEDIEDSPGQGIQRLRDAVAESDGLLIATPEYNQSVPGATKNLIDWLTRSGPASGLAGRPVAVTGASTGPWGTRIAQTSLRQMLHSAGALVMPSPSLFIANVESLLDEEGRLTDPETRQRLGDLVAGLVDWIRLMHLQDTTV